MPEITVKYNDDKALKALEVLAKEFDMVLIHPEEGGNKQKKRSLPITFAKNPDVMALAGIWKGKEISLKEIRKDWNRFDKTKK
jgi:hypothetical protein